MTTTNRTEGNDTMTYRPNIDPLHPDILKSYKGAVQGTDANGTTDIEFPTLHHATSWAMTCEVSHRTYIRNDAALRCLESPTVIQLTPHA